MKRLMRFTVGALLGGTIAGIIVILFTPQSGDEVRTKLGEKIHDIRNQVKKAIEQQRQELEEEWNSDVD